MASKKIVDYVNKALESGMKQKEIESILKEKGWKQADISQALKDAQGSARSMPKASAAQAEKPKQETEPKPEKQAARTKAKSEKEEMQAAPTKAKSEKEEMQAAPTKAKSEKETKEIKSPSAVKNGSMPFKDASAEDNKTGRKRGFLGFLKRFKRAGKQEDRGQGKPEQEAKGKKGGKTGKKQKEKAVAIVYKKPAGKLTTEVDDMLVIISDKKKIRINKLAKLMKVKDSEVKEWMETLENWGIIEVHYPLFGEPVLTMAKKKIKKDEDKQS